MSALIFATTQVSAEVVDQVAPVGTWLFEEGKGIVTKDSSKSDNDGAIKGNVKWGKGKFGSGLVFDGKKENYVGIADSDSLNMNEQITVALYFSTEKKMAEATKWTDR